MKNKLAIKPLFPSFKALEIEDREAIEAFNRQFSPYSDFNFVSLFSWDINNDAQWCWHNGNLVIKFKDYITQKPFYSFLGTHQVHDTANQLLDLSKTHHYSEDLRLIPEITVAQLLLDKSNLHTIEDEDSHDYILSVDKLITMSGKKLGPKRNFINRFKNNYLPDTKVFKLDISDLKEQQRILQLFYKWEHNSRKERNETQSELKAIQKIFKFSNQLNLAVIGITIKDRLVAFSMDEAFSEYGFIHYEKADTSFIGLWPFLKQSSAQMLKNLGCEYINYEQDLGLENLRKAKRSFDPVKLLKKFKISR